MAAMTVRCAAHPATFVPECDVCVEIADNYRELKADQAQAIADGEKDAARIELVYA